LTADGLEIAVQNAAEGPGVPEFDFIERCARRALAGREGELVIRIVDEAESASLNERYRGKRAATNVLAFPVGETMAPGPEPKPLGDIVICGPVVAREAEQQKKPLEEHWAHIVIHGCLHLCGYDHEADAEAERMEARERSLLSEFGIPDPYRSET
jgi:probable rRNA maturation factor